MHSGTKKYYAQVTALEKVSAIGHALLTRKRDRFLSSIVLILYCFSWCYCVEHIHLVLP